MFLLFVICCFRCHPMGSFEHSIVSAVYSPEELLVKYTNPIYLVYCALLALIVISLHVLHKYITNQLNI